MRKISKVSTFIFLAMSLPTYAYVDIPAPQVLTTGVNQKFYYMDVPENPHLFTFLPTYADTPRVFLWGLTGTETIGRGDGMIPIFHDQRHFWYTDLQAKVATDNAWFAGVGAGYRGLARNNIYGGYLFLDRNVSPDHNVFYVLSPGAEIINHHWDGRVNLYFPVSEKRKRGPSFFPSGDNACGEHGDCDFVEFRGHQQFEHRFFNFEEVGTGIDGELGYNFGPQNNLSIHAGAYYYEFKDKSHIDGLEARVEIPFFNNFAVSLETNFDSDQHIGVVAGLRMQLGQTHRPNSIVDHFYDRVARHLGTVTTGAGTITQKGRKDEGLFLRRDNIFFFTAVGGTIFTGTDSGTFDNPLRADQFTSANLAAIKALTGNGNFYFSPGLYSYGATTINVLAGQSLFGRTADYRCTAVGAERPILDFAQPGTAMVITGGNNVIDSIILQNQVTGPAVIVTLDVENNSDLFICNSVIDAQSTVIGDLVGANNNVTALVANNSRVVINDSVIQALAAVTEDSVSETNTAVAIGTNFSTASFTNNSFILHGVSLFASATIGGDTIGVNNLSVGIGNVGGAAFFGNNFIVTQSFVNAQAFVGGTHQSFNGTVGIGNVSANLFSGNNFTLTDAQVRANAIVGSNSNGQNFATGVGNIIGFTTDNNFSFSSSSVLANAIVREDNTNAGENVAVGIGDILGANFIGNIITLNQSEVFAAANTGSNSGLASNFVVGLGDVDTLDFTNNIYTVNDSFIQAIAATGSNDAGSSNQAFGILSTSANPPNTNIFNINRSAFLVEALVSGLNAGTNSAVGIFADVGTFVNATDSVFDIIALVGANTGTNSAAPTGGTAPASAYNFTNVQFNITQN